MSREYFEEGEIPLLELTALIYKAVDFHSQKKIYDLTKTQFLVLAALYHSGSLNMTKISEYISSSKEQATRAVSPLADRRLVSRIEHPDNRKHVYLELTDEGRELVERLRHEMREKFKDRVESLLSPDEKEALFSSAETLTTILTKLC